MRAGTLARPEQAARGGSGVLFAIARFEANKIWRHPALILAALVTVYELYQQVDWTRAPVLNRDSYTSSWPMIIYAAGVFLAIGMTVNRRHGAQADEAMDALPVTPLTRVLGTGLAFLSPLLVAILMQGTVLLARSFHGAATSIVWAEALTGPVAVALGGAAGMAVGWVFKSPLALPLAGLGFLIGTLLVWWEDFLFGYYTPWLAAVPSLDRNQYVFEQVYRPSGLHLIYLSLLAVFFLAVATLRGRRGRHRVISGAGTLILLGAVIWVGAAQLGGLTSAEEAEWESQYLPPTADYTCDQRGSVNYCAYQGYGPWIDEWAAEVEAVLELVPGEAAARSLEVRQQIPYFVDEEELASVADIATGMWWSRRAYDGSLVPHRLGMSLATAGWAVGFPTERLPIESGSSDTPGAEVVDPVTGDQYLVQAFGCSSHGQARAVAALWYAIQSSSESREALEFQVSGERFGGLSPQDNVEIDIGYRQPSSTVAYFRREAIVALELDEMPVADVATTFEGRWSELTDPRTTTEDVAGWFGVEVPAMGPAFGSGNASCP